MAFLTLPAIYIIFTGPPAPFLPCPTHHWTQLPPQPARNCHPPYNRNTGITTHHLTMPPRLRFFIVRPEVTTQTATGAIHKQLGPIVPLIPADELPDWLDVVGAPR